MMGKGYLGWRTRGGAAQQAAIIEEATCDQRADGACELQP
jgi:hypothetical protein